MTLTKNRGPYEQKDGCDNNLTTNNLKGKNMISYILLVTKPFLYGMLPAHAICFLGFLPNCHLFCLFNRVISSVKTHSPRM